MTRFDKYLRISPLDQPMIDDKCQIIILPDDLKLVDMYRVKFGESERTLVTGNESIFEILEITGTSRYDEHPAPTLPTSEAVKSVIMEDRNSDLGICLRKPNMMIATKFNMLYFFAPLLADHSTFSTRFQDIDDIRDQIQDFGAINGWNETIETALSSSLDILCEFIVEADQKYYKFSKAKLMSFLKTKVEMLSSSILASEESNLFHVIKLSLVSPNSIPRDIMEAQALRYAIDMIILSYFSLGLRNEFLDAMAYNFDHLESYLKQIRLQTDERTSSNTQMTAKQHENKTTKNRKKREQKVAVGKGALDSFFKRG